MEKKMISIFSVLILTLVVFSAGCLDEDDEVFKAKGKIEVLQAEERWYDFSDFEPDLGKVFLYLQLKITNKNQENDFSVIYFNFDLVDATGLKYTPHDDDSPSTTIAPKGTLTFWLSFEVPTDTVGKTIEYTPGLFITDPLTDDVPSYNHVAQPDRWEVTVHDSGRVDDNASAYDGDFYVNLTVKNVSPIDRGLYASLFEVEDAGSTQYIKTGEDTDPTATYSENEEVRWTSYFDVPNGTTPIKIVYDDGDFEATL